MVHATTSRPPLVVTADGRGVASHAGTRLLADVADAAGLSAAFEDASGHARQRRSGHRPGRVLADLAVMLADGGEVLGATCLEHVGVMVGDDVSTGLRGRFGDVRGHAVAAVVVLSRG